jgi:hypothetical protein
MSPNYFHKNGAFVSPVANNFACLVLKFRKSQQLIILDRILAIFVISQKNFAKKM